MSQDLAPAQLIRKEGPALRIFAQEAIYARDSRNSVRNIPPSADLAEKPPPAQGPGGGLQGPWPCGDRGLTRKSPWDRDLLQSARNNAAEHWVNLLNVLF